MSSASTENGASGLHRATRYRALLGNREVVALLSARTVSGVGDQAARAVLALYVLQREGGGPVESALVLAVMYLPMTVGLAFLGSIADRFPRRTVMLVADLGRAAIIGVLAAVVTTGAPLWLLLLLLLAAESISSPVTAAQQTLLHDASRDSGEYQVAMGVQNSMDQAVQVVGFLVGGAALALLDARWALAFDSLTFVASFVITLLLVRHRGAVAAAGTSARRLVHDFRSGARTVARTPSLRALTLLLWAAAGLLVATDGAALPYATDLGAGPLAATALLAATPAGAAVAAAWVGSRTAVVQVRMLFPMAFASTVPLLATAFEPPLVVVVPLWFVSGLLQGYVVTLMTLTILLTPEKRRGRVSGIVGAGFNAMAIVTLVTMGVVTQAASPAAAVVLAGAVGLVLLGLLAMVWPKRDVSQALREAYGYQGRRL